MNRQKVAGIFCASWFVLCLIAQGEPQLLDSQITAVTVYAGRALVTRTAHVHLAPGEHELVFPALPGSLQENSVGVSARGTATARILRLAVQRQHLGEPQNERIRQLEAQIQDLRDRDRALQDQQSVAREKMSFLDKIQIFSVEKLGRDVALGDVKVETWGPLLEFVATTQGESLQTVRNIDAEHRELGRQIQKLEKELGELRGFRPTEVRAVNVWLDVQEAGQLEMALRYVVPGATWLPLYDLRCDRQNNSVELVYYGNVQQATGEDWTGVTLSLSTAKPAVGADLPDLEPWYIITAPLPVRGLGGFLGDMAKREKATLSMQAPNESLAKWEEAVAEETGLAVVFTAQGKESVPSTNQWHRNTIASVALKADFTYVTVPKVKPFAFLKAEVKNTTGLPLLAGVANVFHGTDFVGESSLKTILPDESFEAFVGADEFVRVERELLVDKVKHSFWGKNATTETTYRITVQNQRAEVAKVIVRDQIPLSRTPDIKVSGFTSEPRPTVMPTDENKGTVEWHLTLQPGQKTTIEFGFSIT